MAPNIDGLARVAFDAYNLAGNNPGLTWDGKPVPAWDDLPQNTRDKWVAAMGAGLTAAGVEAYDGGVDKDCG